MVTLSTEQADKIQTLINENEMRATTYYKIIRKYQRLHQFEDQLPLHIQKLLRDTQDESNYLLEDLNIRIRGATG